MEGTRCPGREESTKKPSQLQTQIDTIFATIHNLIPKVTFTYLNKSTSAKNSKAFLVNPKDKHCVGEDLVVRVDMFDYLDNRKTYGGDFLRPRLFSPELGASVSGTVLDLKNGSYHVRFPLYWPGKAKISILLWYPSEGVAALWRARHASLGVLTFFGKYVYGAQEVISPCHFYMSPTEALCEYKDELYEEAFYCKKPDNLPCDCLLQMRAVEHQVSHLSPEENQMFQGSNIAAEIVRNLEPITIEKCKETSPAPKPKCTPGMKSVFPSGYFFNSTWNPVYCKMTVYKAEDFSKCLQGKKLYLIGDSTVRQFINHFLGGIHIVKHFRHLDNSSNSWEDTVVAINLEKDIYVSYKRHGFPLENTLFYYVMDDMYTSRQIDLQGGGKDTIFVISLGQHFRQFPLKLFIKRALNIRRAIERLFLRRPETKVIIKSENTREATARPDKFGDFHGYCQYLVLREIFQGINVGFVDAWDMTVASATAVVHPTGPTFDNIMSLTFSFACI